MPVQLPAQPAGINLPDPPQDPPILTDIVAAKLYKAQVDVATASQAPNAPTADDMARADVYETSIIIAHSAAAVPPPWFKVAMAPMVITVAQIRNHQLLDGTLTSFKIVPFTDGSTPTQAPHDLPPLLNVAAIRGLTAAESSAYAAGYDLGNIGTASARRAAIGRAIGCTVAI